MKISIVGAGASSLFCSYFLIKKGHSVDLYEKESTAFKKFLIAGKSGLNITNDEELDSFHYNYFENKDLFKGLLKDFSKEDTKAWLQELGIENFVGSSKKVFPKTFKAAGLIKKIKDYLEESNRFNLYLNHKLIDFDNEKLYFEDSSVKYDKAILALGGASWKKTGSDGQFLSIFTSKNIKVNEFKPSNCGFISNIKSEKRIPIKNAVFSFMDKSIRAEALITEYGIEGGAIYPLSSYIRSNLDKSLYIDFYPDKSVEKIIDEFNALSNKLSYSNKLKKVFPFDKDLFEVIKRSLTKDEYLNFNKYLMTIKSFRVEIKRPVDIDQAISTSGGVCFTQLEDDFSLKEYSNIYLTGEMLDWEAPTGGFLIQGCFSISYRIIHALSLLYSM